MSSDQTAQHPTLEVRHDPDRQAYVLYRDGSEVGHAAYHQVRDQVVNVHHTEVNPAFEGQSLGSALVKNTLDQIREAGLSLIPGCPFVASYIRRHPEYEDLLA